MLFAHPSPDLYGSDRMLLESVAAFAAAGWDVDVVLPGDGPLVAELAVHPCRVAFAPMPVLRKAYLSPIGLPRLTALALRSLTPSLRLIRTSRPDLVYVNTVTIPSWMLLGRLTGRSVLAHVHEAEEGLPGGVAAGLAAPLLAAHAVVVNSLATRGVLEMALPALRKRTTLVRNGVPGPPETKPVPERRPDRPRLALVGRLSPRKGTDVAVEAVRLLRERGRHVELDLVGSVFPGYEWFEEQLRSRVGEAGLTEAVTFTGFVTDPSAALARADIALVPSRVEPFGNTSIEAQLARRPVVVSRTQGLVETVDDGAVGALAEPGDAISLADVIDAVLDDWPAARDRADRARERAVRDFSPEQYRRSLVALADRLISR